MKQTRFIPTNDCGLQLREPQEGQQESREVEGRPIVFGVRSVNLTPWSSDRKVYEILEPGCISRELLQRSDVVLNLNHNSDVVNVLGRYRNSERDTLSLELRGDGIDCRCDLPHTNNANDTLELIKRGDINGMSFAFEDDWEDTENGVSYEKTNDVEDGKVVWLRHVKRITRLYDVSIVTHPAYEQTSVATREQADAIDAAIEEQLKREREAEEEAQRRACGGKGKDDKRDDDPDDDKNDPDDKNETDEEREAREKAEREAREQAQREVEKEQRERERMAAQRRHQRNRARRISSEILESLEY